MTSTLSVAVIPFPGFLKPPTDPDNDWLYEDLNAKGRPDFTDVVLYFSCMDWLIGNEPLAEFDFNGNGRIDFDNIVRLFDEV